jgi:hypothetical protein
VIPAEDEDVISDITFFNPVGGMRLKRPKGGLCDDYSAGRDKNGNLRRYRGSEARVGQAVG